MLQRSLAAASVSKADGTSVASNGDRRQPAARRRLVSALKHRAALLLRLEHRLVCEMGNRLKSTTIAVFRPMQNIFVHRLQRKREQFSIAEQLPSDLRFFGCVLVVTVARCCRLTPRGCRHPRDAALPGRRQRRPPMLVRARRRLHLRSRLFRPAERAAAVVLHDKMRLQNMLSLLAAAIATDGRRIGRRLPLFTNKNLLINA